MGQNVPFGIADGSDVVEGHLADAAFPATNTVSGKLAAIAIAANKFLFGTQKDLLVSLMHGNKYFQAKNGNLFFGANPSGVTTSAGLATTCVGLILSNPAANTKNLVLRRAAAAFIVAPSVVTSMNLITGYAAGGVTVHTTPLAPTSSLVGTGPAATGLLDSAATLVGTPAYSLVLAQNAVATQLPSFSVDLEGGLILPPGAYAAIGTTIAGPASGFQGSFEWEEVPV